jgi:branched-chain amino acid transport system permease protein
VGLMFVIVVMYAPWGLGGLLLMHQPLLAGGTLKRVLPAYAWAAPSVLMLAAGGVLLVETVHHLLVKATEGSAMHVFWVSYDAKSPLAWAVIALLLVVGVLALRRVAPKVSDAYHAAAQEARHGRGA